MASRPINAQLKPHVEAAVAAAAAKAAAQFAGFTASLNGKAHFTQCQLLQQELAAVEKTIDANEYPFYVNNYSADNWLITQFANRCLLLNVDETAELREATRLGAYRHDLWQLQRQLKASIPVYTYADFAAGVYDPYLMELDQLFNVSEEDYYRIKEWQTPALRKVVQHDFEQMVGTLRHHCQAFDDPMAFLQEQNRAIDDLVMHHTGTTEQLLQHLQVLLPLSGADLSGFDRTLLQQSHAHFVSEVTQLKLGLVHPQSFGPSLAAIQANPTQLAPNEASIFYSLNKLQDWIERVVEGTPLYAPVTEPDWDEVLETIEAAALATRDEEEKALCDYLESTADADPVIKRHFFDRFEHYRAQFNQLEEKFFFHVVDPEQKALLRNTFVTNAFFSNDLPGQAQALQKATTIHECLWLIISLYGERFDTHKMDLPEESGGHMVIHSLLNKMILDKASHETIMQSMDDFATHFEHYRLPFELHLQNSIEVWRRQFFAGMDRLQQILDDADPSQKTLYLQSRIKELRHRELSLREYAMDEAQKKEDHYAHLFKEFLRIEANFVRETRDLPASLPIPLLTSGPTSKALPSLDDLVSPAQKELIRQLLEDLGITKDGRSVISERKKGALRGIVEALRERDLLPANSLEVLCQAVAREIGLELKAKLDYSTVMDDFKQKAKKYLATHSLT